MTVKSYLNPNVRLEIDHHLEINVVGMNMENKLADQFTKGLPEDKFVKDRKILMGW